MCITDNLAHKITIDKLGEGVFLHKKHKGNDDGFIFTKGYGVINEEYIWFFTPDGKVQGKHRIQDVYVDGVNYPDKDALSLALKELGHVIYDQTVTPPIDYTALLTSILEAVDELELNTENINLNAEQINLNTDEVEELLTDIKDLLTADVIGESCDTPSFTKDCDRAELLAKLDAVSLAITNNATLNKTDLVNKLDELKVVLTSIETNTATSNDNEALIITELETANTTLEAILAEQNKSLVYTTSTAICVDGVTQMTRVKTIWDNEANVAISETAEFSLDGVTWTTTVPTGTITIGSCVAEDTTKVMFQPADCSGNPIGDEEQVVKTIILNKVISSICNVADITGPLTAKLDEVIAAINDTSTAEQAILTSIDTKLDELVLIKDELVEANATLVLIKDEAIDINANTAEIVTQTTLTNTKLDEIKVKLDTQITELGNIKNELIDANTSLDTVNANLVTINDNIVLIKADIATIKTDIAAIKTSVANIEADTEEIKVAVQSIDTKLTTVNDHLTTIEGKLDTINTTLQTEFDQTQVLLDEVKTAIEFAQDTFQIEDCDGNPVGTEQNVLKVVQLAKQTADICNTDDITTPIVDKLDELLAAINATEAPDYTALLTSIDTKLDELAVITGELETANVTLDGIKVDTAGIKTDTAGILTQVTTANTNLVNIKTELETQTIKLEDIKTLITDTNVELVDVNAELDTISGNIVTIKNDIATIKADIATIKTDVAEIKTNTAAIKVAVESIDLKLDTVITSLSSIEDKLDTVHDDLVGITSILQDIKDELNQSLVYSSSQPICVDGVNHLVRIKSIWDNETGTLVSNTTEYSADGSVWATTAPTGTVVLGYCSVNDNTFTTFQPTDCDGVNVGSPVDVKRTVVVNNVQTELCNTADLVDPLSAKLDDVIAAINNTSTAEQDILNSIDTKLDDLALIKAELVTANTTLSNIKTDTAAINTNLLDVIGELESQTTLLTDIKAQAIAGNVKLEDIKTLLGTIDTNILTIKNDLATIKTDIASIKTGVQSIDTKLSTVITSLASIETKLDTLHNDLVTINGTLQTEFDQTQEKLDDVISALEYAQDTFQLEDCDGLPIGPSQNVMKVVQIAKQRTTICNVDDIAGAINTGANYTPITDKLDLLIGLSTPIVVENKSYQILAGQSITFEANKIFAYGAGVFNGSANYTEGGSTIGNYSQGESFGNGDRNNLVFNINPVTINALANGDVRISVLQLPNYSPIIL